MTRTAAAYGGALYDLARDEGLSRQLLQELECLQEAFCQEPGFLRLLSGANLTKPQRCQIIEDSFRKLFHPYVVNFLKILTQRGYADQFSGCCDYFRHRYDQDNDILPVLAVTAVPLTKAQQEKLTARLARITGKTVVLTCQVDPSCLGGVRLDFDGQRLDGTLRHRLNAIGQLLKRTAL